MQADHNLNGLYRIILIQNKLFLTLRTKSLLAKRGRRNGGGAAASGGLSRSTALAAVYNIKARILLLFSMLSCAEKEA